MRVCDVRRLLAGAMCQALRSFAGGGVEHQRWNKIQKSKLMNGSPRHRNDVIAGIRRGLPRNNAWRLPRKCSVRRVVRLRSVELGSRQAGNDILG